MNRRGFLGFFSRAAGAGALAVGAKVSNVEATDRFEYRGFVAEWTGWKQMANSEVIVGQWLAKRPDHKDRGYLPEDFSVYASYPGGGGKYWDGYVFDTSVHPNQKLITQRASEELKNRCKEECKHQLTVYIDMALAAPTHATRDDRTITGFAGFGTTSAAFTGTAALPAYVVDTLRSAESEIKKNSGKGRKW